MITAESLPAGSTSSYSHDIVRIVPRTLQGDLNPLQPWRMECVDSSNLQNGRVSEANCGKEIVISRYSAPLSGGSTTVDQVSQRPILVSYIEGSLGFVSIESCREPTTL